MNVFHDPRLTEFRQQAGSGDSTKWDPIHNLAEKVGTDIRNVPPTIHTLAGCDYTWKFGTKIVAFNADSIRHFIKFSFQSFESNMAEEYFRQYFLCVRKLRSTFETLNGGYHTRSYHHGMGVTRRELPPCSQNLRLDMLRSFHATSMIRSLMFRPYEQLNPANFEYKVNDAQLILGVNTNNLPEHYSTCCMCQNCVTSRCACKHRDMPCCRCCNGQSAITSDADCRNSLILTSSIWRDVNKSITPRSRKLQIDSVNSLALFSHPSVIHLWAVSVVVSAVLTYVATVAWPQGPALLSTTFSKWWNRRPDGDTQLSQSVDSTVSVVMMYRRNSYSNSCSYVTAIAIAVIYRTI